jgi:hypothetical protein
MWMARAAGSDGDSLISDAVVAISDSADGDYTFLRSFRPLDQLNQRDPYDDSFYTPPYGYMSGPCTVFVDDDGTGYFVSSRAGKEIKIYRLSDDYLDIDGLVTTLFAGQEFGRYTPVLFKRQGVYFLLLSDSSGEIAYATTTNLATGWSAAQQVPNSAALHSFAAAVLPVSIEGESRFLFLGDALYDVTDATFTTNFYGNSYVWLPLSFPSESDLDLSFAPALEIDAAASKVDAVDSEFSLINVESGLALDVQGASTSDGAPLVAATPSGAPSQSWTLEYMGEDTFHLVNVNSGLVLTNDYADASPQSNRVPLRQSTPSDLAIPAGLSFAPPSVVNPSGAGSAGPDQFVIYLFDGERVGFVGSSSAGAIVDAVSASGSDFEKATVWQIVMTGARVGSPR